jgi:hypothetical protein
MACEIKHDVRFQKVVKVKEARIQIRKLKKWLVAKRAS